MIGKKEKKQYKNYDNCNVINQDIVTKLMMMKLVDDVVESWNGNGGRVKDMYHFEQTIEHALWL
jgi:hypothetical protein